MRDNRGGGFHLLTWWPQRLSGATDGRP